MTTGKFTRAVLSLVDGRFKLVESAIVRDMNGKRVGVTRRVRYPKIQILKRGIRVGCTTVSREAALKLLNIKETGFLQAEATE
jgi:hypothetical protein